MEDSLSDKMKFLSEFLQELKLTNFKGLNRHARKHGVVFIGDSITEGFPIHELLRSDRPMYNRGIGGETTEGLLNKLNHVALDLEPAQVFLMIGTNDLFQGVAARTIVNRIEQICKKIKADLPEADLIVQSVYPVNSAAEPPNAPFPVVGSRTNETIIEMNEAIEQVAQRMRLPYIDLFSRLLDDQGSLKAAFTYDGLHLSIAGYEVVRDEIQRHLINR